LLSEFRCHKIDELTLTAKWM